MVRQNYEYFSSISNEQLELENETDDDLDDLSTTDNYSNYFGNHSDTNLSNNGNGDSDSNKDPGSDKTPAIVNTNATDVANNTINITTTKALKYTRQHKNIPNKRVGKRHKKYKRIAPLPGSKHNKESVKDMWNAYLELNSLTRVGELFGISRENVRYRFKMAGYDYGSVKKTKKCINVTTAIPADMLENLKNMEEGKVATNIKKIVSEYFASAKETFS